MANQPKSYRKFVAGSVTAALVATAVSPVFAAETQFKDEADFGSHKDNIYKAAELGLVKGYTAGENEGKFMPNTSVKRGQVVKTLARHLEAVHGTVDTAGVTPFADVPADYADQELYEASLIVKKYGTFEGVNNNLLPNNNISRQAMAKVLVKAFNLVNDPEVENKVKDLEAADEEFRPYIEILSKNGVTAVSEYNPKSHVSRAQYASFLVRAVDAEPAPDAPTVTEIKSEDSTHLLVTIKGDVDSVEASDFVFDGDLEVKDAEIVAAPVKAAAAQDAEFTYVRLTTSEQVAGKEYKLVEFMDEKIAEDDQPAVVVPAPVAPAVESVMANNLKEVQITFNKEVDVTNAAFSITDVKTGSSKFTQSTSTVKLSPNKKSVILTTSSNLVNGDFYNVSVKDVVVKDSKEPIKPFSTSVKLDDKTAPAIEEIKALTTSTTTRAINVKFTEPVSFGLVKIGDDIATASNPSGDQKTWTFALANSSAKDLEVGKSYELNIAGLADLAGNYASNPFKQSVTVVRDEVKPTFTLQAKNPKQFDIVFDKEMNSSVAYDSIVVKDSNDNVLTQSNLATLDTDDKKTFHVTLNNSPIASDKTSAEISVTVKGLKDTVGNTISEKTEKVTLAKEAVKPEFNGVRVLPGTDNKIEVAFSEKVMGVDNTDFVLTNSKGDVVATSSLTNASSDSDNKVVLTTAAALANDTYNLALKVDTVTDTSGNKNAAKALKFSYNGAVAPQLVATIDSDFDGATTSAVLDSTTANRKVLVKFNQADVVNGIDKTTGDYKLGAADNLANYTVNGLALPEGTTVTFNNVTTVSGGVGDTALIDFSAVTDTKKLPTELVKGGKLIITASNVKTEANSTIAYTSNEVTVVDKTAPKVNSAFLTGNSTDGYKLTAVFSEELSVADKAEFVLKSTEGTPVTITLDDATIVSADKNKVEFNIIVDKAKVATAIAASAGFKLTTTTTPANTKDTATTPNALQAETTGLDVVNYSN
ncbi:hypothetical protein JOC78_001351 [Bacillus ectoiniformans]|uniref:S-layer homology domain-containing protein n=1 Tax=Bacillus ectoiniformans TaxID=1494429 RepID=UPI00195D5D66|nr:S-layer homology domain-containing protein [Bacillus ectoiniformans]MBM7648409.1 hypothetical protein [Bacillus ectoiniformans]